MPKQNKISLRPIYVEIIGTKSDINTCEQNIAPAERKCLKS